MLENAERNLQNSVRRDLGLSSISGQLRMDASKWLAGESPKDALWLRRCLPPFRNGEFAIARCSHFPGAYMKTLQPGLPGRFYSKSVPGPQGSTDESAVPEFDHRQSPYLSLVLTGTVLRRTRLRQEKFASGFGKVRMKCCAPKMQLNPDISGKKCLERSQPKPDAEGLKIAA
jgi:hypothetical protein